MQKKSIRATIKHIAPSIPKTLNKIRKIITSFNIFIFDAKTISNRMRWDTKNKRYWVASSELLFWYHKIEKGLCIGGKQRFFGADAAVTTIKLIDNWKTSGLPLNDPIYLGSIETLRAYSERLEKTPPPSSIDFIDAKLSIEGIILENKKTISLETPIKNLPSTDEQFDIFHKIALGRRSVRCFSEKKVDPSLLIKAIKTAQLSPSACNRQPWRIHIYENRAEIDSILSLQNGNSGFGHNIPVLLAICADAGTFLDATERHEPYLDTGLFLMTFIHALYSLGIASCCLNWCVEPSTNREVHKRSNIDPNEIIVTFLAVGYADPNAKVPLSPRRAVESIVQFH